MLMYNHEFNNKTEEAKRVMIFVMHKFAFSGADD